MQCKCRSMPVPPDCFYRAWELQKILNWILGKGEQFLWHLQTKGYRSQLFFFLIYPVIYPVNFTLQYRTHQLMRGISHWQTVLLKAGYWKCSCFRSVEGNMQTMSLPGGFVTWSIWRFLLMWHCPAHVCPQMGRDNMEILQL